MSLIDLRSSFVTNLRLQSRCSNTRSTRQESSMSCGPKKDLLVCESRREAERIVCDVANAAKIGESRPGSLVSRLLLRNRPVAMQTCSRRQFWDIKLILDIEKALTNDLDFGNPRNPQPVQDQLLTIIDEADAVGAAQRPKPAMRPAPLWSALMRRASTSWSVKSSCCPSGLKIRCRQADGWRNVWNSPCDSCQTIGIYTKIETLFYARRC